jgi:aldehyde:ferredoxin oxidoreductase
LTGCSESPCTLVIADGQILFEDASPLWGKGAVESVQSLEQRHGKIRALTIGPAGEACSPIATVINDRGRASGVRHGVGALLGSKRVKALVIRDNQRACRHPSDAKAYQALLSRVHGKIRESPVLNPKTGTMSVHGTAIAVEALGQDQAMPVGNYSRTELPAYLNIGGLAMSKKVLVERMSCSHCPVQCRRETGSTGKYSFRSEGPDYAQLSSLGSNCFLTDIEAVSYLNYLCYEEGIDPIEMGNVLAMVAEATERGWISGREGLLWGDTERMIELVHLTAQGRDLGGLLQLGASGAAVVLGRPELAMSIKGISIQNCDPRPEPAWGLLNATETFGSAAHIWSYGELVYAMRHVGVRPIVGPDSSPRQIAEAVIRKQDQIAALDSLSMCAFSIYAYAVEDYCEALRLLTGQELSPQGLLLRGREVFELERRFNLDRGLTAQADTLPARFTDEPVPSGLHRGRRCELAPMLEEYYALRGWAGLPLSSPAVAAARAWMDAAARKTTRGTLALSGS